MSHDPRSSAAALVEQLSEIGQHVIDLVDLADALDRDDTVRLRGVILQASMAIGAELESLADELVGERSRRP